MANTKRQDILLRIEATLGGVTGIATVVAGKWGTVDLDNLALPAAFIVFGPDRTAEVGAGFEGFWIPASVEVWCPDDEMETLIGAIHTAVLADVTCGGFALNTKRDSCTPFSIDPGRSLAGFDLVFQILYRHPVGYP